MKTSKTICTVCNYIFDELLGEPRQDISPDVSFEALPDTWACPECGSNKEMFQPCSCVSLHVYEMSCVKPARAASTEQATTGTEMLRLPVGQLVAQDLNRACIFEQYGIDYCCGGKKTLEQAVSEMNLPAKEVIRKLMEVSASRSTSCETDWNKASLSELTKHIVKDYHEPLRAELPRLLQLIEKVGSVHGKLHPEVLELETIFKSFKEQLELHMQKEELILFPGIANVESGRQTTFGCGGSINHPIEMMTQEHEDAAQALEMIRRLTNDYTPPADACGTFKVMLHSLANLELVMHEHVHKENNILFPRALSIAREVAGCS